MGWPYSAVGMQSASQSAMGLPSSSTSASRMLAFVTPPEVSRSFNMPPAVSALVGAQEKTEIHCGTHRRRRSRRSNPGRSIATVQESAGIGPSGAW